MSKKLIGVTGAGGFIGGHVVEHLLAQGYPVRALVHYNSCCDKGHLNRLAASPPPTLEIVRGDVRDGTYMREFVEGLDCCLHLAALIGVPYSFEAPVSYLQTNVDGTLNLLEAVRAQPSTKLVFASTSEIFGNNPKIPIPEDAPLLPASPYAASKVAAERFIYAYTKSYPEIDALIVRPFNTYGPRQSMRAVIPTIIQQALVRDELKLGAPDTSRDFVYVKDVARFYEVAIDMPRLEEPIINVGTGEDHSIRQVVEFVGEILGKQLGIVHDESRMRPTKAEVHRLNADITYVTTSTSWRPAYGFRDGLAEMVEWIKEHPENADQYGR